jgi:hypothetical protein
VLFQGYRADFLARACDLPWDPAEVYRLSLWLASALGRIRSFVSPRGLRDWRGAAVTGAGACAGKRDSCTGLVGHTQHKDIKPCRPEPKTHEYNHLSLATINGEYSQVRVRDMCGKGRGGSVIN